MLKLIEKCVAYLVSLWLYFFILIWLQEVLFLLHVPIDFVSRYWWYTWFSLERRKQRDLISVYNCLNGGCQEPVRSHWCQAIGQEPQAETGTRLFTRTWTRTSLLFGLLNTGTNCPVRLWITCSRESCLNRETPEEPPVVPYPSCNSWHCNNAWSLPLAIVVRFSNWNCVCFQWWREGTAQRSRRSNL